MIASKVTLRVEVTVEDLGEVLYFETFNFVSMRLTSNYDVSTLLNIYEYDPVRVVRSLSVGGVLAVHPSGSRISAHHRDRSSVGGGTGYPPTTVTDR